MAATRRTPRTTTYGNLAYDLDAIVRERQLEEAGTMPERQAQPQPKPQPRARAHARPRTSPVLVGAIVVLCALVMVLMLGFVQLTKVSTSVSQIKSELSTLNDEHVSLVTTYERTFDLATIKSVAEAAGMSKPSAGQIEYIDLSGADSAVVYRDTADTVLQGIYETAEAGVKSIWEYFN